jgi:hypothetical protein
MEIEAVRRVLLKLWDPLDVGENANLADEYDGCLPTILAVLAERPSQERLMNALAKLEVELGAPLPVTRRTEAAVALLKIDVP